MFLSFSPTAWSQRLVIGVTKPAAEFSKIIYGRYIDGSIWIFEKEFKLTPLNSGTGTESASKRVNVSTLKTSFAFQAGERTACTKGARFKGFAQLVKAFGEKASHVEIRSSSEWLACAQSIKLELDKSGKTVDIKDDGSTELAMIDLFLNADGGEKVSQTEKAEAPTAINNAKSAAVRVDAIQLRIDGNDVPFTSDGYFIFESDSVADLTVVLQVPDYEAYTLDIKPAIVGDKVNKLYGSKFYSERLVSFSKVSTSIAVTPIPQLDAKTSVDGGLGGGYGYGREIPGEEQGDRYYTQLGFQSDHVFAGIGVKGSLSYTYAKKSVVPYTITTRAVALYDASFFKKRIGVEGGFGLEFFKTKIKDPEESVIGTKVETATIPEQVLAPVALIAVRSLLFDKLALTANLYITPLYIANSGFYPSYSPSFEIGYKVNKDWIVFAATGSETHRYPSALGETRLRIDFSLLSLKVGLF